MTKARDLANFVHGIDASKIISGDIAAARLSNATTDTSDIENDLSTLGLRVHSQENLIATNTSSASFDVFQDSSGLGTIINASRNASEYISTVTTSTITPSITHDADQTGVDGDYTWYKWTDTSGTGSFSTNTATTAEWLVVAGGGAGAGDSFGSGVGGSRGVGGGGAGGLRTSYGSTSGGGASAEADLNLGAGTSYTITVGAGGTAGPDNGSVAPSGSASSIAGSDITDITTVGGGGGSPDPSNTGAIGGSGGGGGNGTNGGVGTANQGYGGGNSSVNSNQGSGGGGGGAGSAGTNGSSNYTDGGGTGGNGLSVSITGSAVVYAAGGGGGRNTGGENGGSSGVGGNGAGNGNGDAGNANTGSGGGGSGGVTNTGSTTGGAGGSGVVILRVPTQVTTTTSNATGSFEGATITAGASTSSMGAVITYQDNAGTNALNTDIILKLSANNGSNYSTATLTALPDFATGIKMAKVNDLSVTAGTQLKYKLEFANQASGSKEARIRGVSLQY